MIFERRPSPSRLIGSANGRGGLRAWERAVLVSLKYCSEHKYKHKYKHKNKHKYKYKHALLVEGTDQVIIPPCLKNHTNYEILTFLERGC